MKNVLLAMLTCLSIAACAQEPVPSLQLIKDKGLYRYDQFYEGTVVFKNGNISGAKMNYNITVDEMHFINHAGDTLSLANTDSLYFISLNSTKFYYEKGYLQEVYNSPKIILAFRQHLATKQTGNTSGSGTVISEENQAFNDRFFKGDGQLYKRSNGEIVTVTGSQHYFFGFPNGHFLPANKDNLVVLFPEAKKNINQFIQKNHTNFNQLEDLLKIVQYCEQNKGG